MLYGLSPSSSEVQRSIDLVVLSCEWGSLVRVVAIRDSRATAARVRMSQLAAAGVARSRRPKASRAELKICLRPLEFLLRCLDRRVHSGAPGWRTPAASLGVSGNLGRFPLGGPLRATGCQAGRDNASSEGALQS